MRLEISRKSLEGSLAVINSFYKAEKLDAPHTAILKNGDLGASISVDTHISWITIPLSINPGESGAIAIALDELQTALNVISADPYITFELVDKIIVISDSQGTMKINEGVFDVIERPLFPKLVPVLRTSLRILTPSFKRALNYLPGSTSDYNALYICDTADGIRGVVLEPHRFLVMDLDSIVLDADIVKIPARIINAVTTFTGLEKIDFPITLAESVSSEVLGTNRCLELQVFGEHQHFRFGLLDKNQPPENLSKAKIINQLIPLPALVEVDRETAISTFTQLQKLVSKDENDFVSISANAKGLEMVADPKSMTGIFSKTIPALTNQFDLDHAIKLYINPKQIVEALKCFSDDSVNFCFSGVDTSPLGITPPHDTTVKTYIARYEM